MDEKNLENTTQHNSTWRQVISNKFFTQVYKLTRVSNFLKKEVKYVTKKSSTKKSLLQKQ